MDTKIAGSNPIKATPSRQFEAHHFCKQLNADFMRSVLFDGSTAAADLNGLEYIIHEVLFETVRENEQQ